MDLENKIYRAAELLKQSKYTVVLTGAGLSTESGLADFRSSRGMWAERDPLQLASQEALQNNYPEFRAFYLERIKTLQKNSPHKGHQILAAWEKAGILQAIITQNVDGFHKKAGSSEVIELHGNLTRINCENCSCEVTPETFIEGLNCDVCNGKLRPGVVLFGEGLPQNEWEKALSHLERAQLLIVIGTSLEVSPANQIPLYFRGRGKQILLNQEETSYNKFFDLFIQGSAGETLAGVDKALKNY